MPMFLFVVDVPAPWLDSQDADAASRWSHFASKAKSIALPKGATKLPCRNAWLFLAEGSEKQRRALANAADEFRFGHATYLVSGEVTAL